MFVLLRYVSNNTLIKKVSISNEWISEYILIIDKVFNVLPLILNAYFLGRMENECL